MSHTARKSRSRGVGEFNRTSPFLGMLLISVLVASVQARADSWSIENSTKSYQFGDLTCELITKPEPSNRSVPIYNFTCSRSGKTIFSKEGYGASYVKGTPSGAYLVGLSNSGLTPFSFWIVRSDGTTLKEVSQGDLRRKGIKFCEATVTVVRKWTRDLPTVRFLERAGVLLDVGVRGCDGSFISLNSVSPFINASPTETDTKEIIRFERETSRAYAVLTKQEDKKEKEERELKWRELEKLPSISKLMAASEKGDLAEMRRCIEASIPVNGELFRQPGLATVEKYPLFAAIEADQPQAVALLLSKKADVNLKNSQGVTPLSAAASIGSEKIVRLLLEAEAQPDQAESLWGWTPLMRAAGRGHVKVIRLLLKHGAKRELRDQDGKTALVHAQDSGSTEAIKVLGP